MIAWDHKIATHHRLITTIDVGPRDMELSLEDKADLKRATAASSRSTLPPLLSPLPQPLPAGHTPTVAAAAHWRTTLIASRCLLLSAADSTALNLSIGPRPLLHSLTTVALFLLFPTIYCIIPLYSSRCLICRLQPLRYVAISSIVPLPTPSPLVHSNVASVAVLPAATHSLLSSSASSVAIVVGSLPLKHQQRRHYLLLPTCRALLPCRCLLPCR
ncbi:hypothetical protein B296_00025860 [Ensete ventricosum]|uniref:Uncharacterized protein n=1 Tax=Ensete ventricosum TaxID=4639 RepID=A0A426YQ27_ENSVE|nr:hypothetical protein B296_00025860 [Ensete ventricosum]